MNERDAPFRDPRELTRWTKGLLYASIPLALVSVAASWRDYQYLANTGEPAPARDAFGSLLVLLVGPTAIVTVAAAILVLAWIHRANHNARALGAEGMQFTPGWAVGWYFIPLASLWKPYQAMKEICRASVRPSRWWKEETPALLTLWWGLWLLTTGAQGISWTVSTEAAVSISDVVREVLRIPLTLVLVSIINRVHMMQMAHYRTRSTGEFDHE